MRQGVVTSISQRQRRRPKIATTWYGAASKAQRIISRTTGRTALLSGVFFWAGVQANGVQRDQSRHTGLGPPQPPLRMKIFLALPQKWFAYYPLGIRRFG